MSEAEGLGEEHGGRSGGSERAREIPSSFCFEASGEGERESAYLRVLKVV